MSANFEHCIFMIFFRFSVYNFFSCLQRCCGFVYVVFEFFFPASFFIYFPLLVLTILHFFGWFAQYCLCKIPTIVHEGEQYSAHEQEPTNKICRRVSNEQRPRTRSCHE